MQKETKIDIIEAAQRYMQQHDLSQNAIADKSGVNISYLNAMLSGKTAIQVKDKPVAIADKWFEMLALVIGFSYKKEYWPFVPTDEFVQMAAVLEAAKENVSTNIIVCNTGAGKTHAVERVSKKYPHHTYVVTTSSLYTMPAILNELLEKLNQPVPVVNKDKLFRIIMKLREIKMSGGNPLIIIDEAENLSLKVLQMLKALYDGVKNHCSVVLIGTVQLLDKLDRMEARNVEGMPQFCRRFRAGRRLIIPTNNFAAFYEKLELTDRPLIRLINSLARNYGELRDYLEPALREADRLGKPLTETLFRQVHYLPAS